MSCEILPADLNENLLVNSYYYGERDEERASDTGKGITICISCI